MSAMVDGLVACEEEVISTTHTTTHTTAYAYAYHREPKLKVRFSPDSTGYPDGLGELRTYRFEMFSR